MSRNPRLEALGFSHQKSDKLNDKVEIQLETPGSIEMMEQGEELCEYLGFSKKLEQITDNDLIQALNIFIDFCDNFKKL